MVEFETIVRGDPEAQIKVGRVTSVRLFSFIGKKVRVTVKECDLNELD